MIPRSRSHWLLCWTLLFGTQLLQSQPIDINTWKKQLSAREDVFSGHLTAIHLALFNSDSTRRCTAFEELHRTAVKSNARMKIRVALLQGMQSNPCSWKVSSIALLEDALDLAYELEDEELIAITHRILGNAYFNQGDGGFSLMHTILSVEQMKQSPERYNNLADLLYGLGDRYYRARDYRTAANSNLEALRYKGMTEHNRSDSLSTYWQMNAWNTLGLCYERLVMYDSALIAFDRALELTQDSFWTGLLKGNQGDVYFLQGRYSASEPLLQIDYTQSLKAGEWHNANITLQRLARIANARGESNKALTMLHEAEALGRIDQVIDYRASLYEGYALVYQRLNKADSVYHYMMRYKLTQDTIEAKAAANKLSLAQLRLSNQDQINEIEDLRKDKKRIQLIRNFTIALILMLALFGYVYVNRMRLKAKLKQQEALEGKRNAEMEAANAHAQLTLFTENLREKTRLLEDLQTRMSEQEQTKVQLEQLEELSQYTILTEADWDRFKHLFVKVYPGFFIELKQHVPDITLAEQRMAALIKLRIPNKDAASMLGISPNSIHKTRQRLRHRMGFTEDTELDRYFRIVEDKGE